jgi:hypothetical protein
MVSWELGLYYDRFRREIPADSQKKVGEENSLLYTHLLSMDG